VFAVAGIAYGMFDTPVGKVANAVIQNRRKGPWYKAACWAMVAAINCFPAPPLRNRRLKLLKSRKRKLARQ